MIKMNQLKLLFSERELSLKDMAEDYFILTNEFKMPSEKVMSMRFTQRRDLIEKKRSE